MDLRHLAVTFFGTGRLPAVPGTWGSAAAVAIWWALASLTAPAGATPPWLRDATLAGLIAIASIGCVALGGWAVERFGSTDPRPVVLDEVAGQWLALLAMPAAAGSAPALAGIAALQFVLFRILDIVKPPPARQAERLPAGWGILSDDLVSGLYANLLGQIVLRFVWPG